MWYVYVAFNRKYGWSRILREKIQILKFKNIKSKYSQTLNV